MIIYMTTLQYIAQTHTLCLLLGIVCRSSIDDRRSHRSSSNFVCCCVFTWERCWSHQQPIPHPPARKRKMKILGYLLSIYPFHPSIYLSIYLSISSIVLSHRPLVRRAVLPSYVLPSFSPSTVRKREREREIVIEVLLVQLRNTSEILRTHTAKWVLLRK